MNNLGALTAVGTNSLLATERSNARRLQGELNELRDIQRRENEARQSPNAAGARQTLDARRSVAQSFAANRAFTAQLAQTLQDEAHVEKPDGANAKPQTGDASVTGMVDAKAGDAKPDSESTSGVKLSEEEQQVVDKLKARDREVRAHEAAHKAVGGRHAGAISYSYQAGPDGQKYAVGGEVSIDVSPESDPDATIQKMSAVIAAALAPAEPSGQDRAVAQAAQATRSQAIADASAERRAEIEARFEETKPSSEAEAGLGALSRKDKAEAAEKSQSNPYELFRTEGYNGFENKLSAIA